jgi:hypothetical protein
MQDTRICRVAECLERTSRLRSLKSAFDPFRQSVLPTDISVERASDVFQMSSLDSYTATL